MTSASNRLYRGECNTFLEAIQAVIDEYEYEKALCPDNEDEAQFISMLEDGLSVAHRLQAEYQMATQVMEIQLIKKWRDESRPGSFAFGIADALASGDYTGLAI